MKEHSRLGDGRAWVLGKQAQLVQTLEIQMPRGARCGIRESCGAQGGLGLGWGSMLCSKGQALF